jgi:uncharacterized protein YecT (DUF1311 family)
MKQISWVVLGWLWMASAQAASFDCAKAQAKVEHLICDNPDISKLDEELAAAYKAALQDKAQAEAIKRAQKQWMKERDGCADVACVKLAYETRLSILSSPDGLGNMHESVGLYKMIEDTFDVPQPNGISKLEKHAEVCTAFLKNLGASPPLPPMACDVTFKPEFTDFKTPKWRDIDILESRDLWSQSWKTPRKGEKERLLADIKANIESGMLIYRNAQFDIDNDGVPDQMLLASSGSGGKCDPEHTYENIYWSGYSVYDPTTRKKDFAKEKFYGGYWKRESIFSYKGVTYYASLFRDSTNEPIFGKNDHAQKWYIRLYRPIPMNQGIKQPVAQGCVYLYQPTKNEGSN